MKPRREIVPIVARREVSSPPPIATKPNPVGDNKPLEFPKVEIDDDTDFGKGFGDGFGKKKKAKK